MDGIEWARAKWGLVARTWFWLNDWAGCWLGDHLVADHPEIKRHLESRVSPHKITMIPYGADSVDSADPSPVRALDLTPGRFLTLIARAEPENSVLEMVRAFSGKRRGVNLVVLGNYDFINNPYHRAVRKLPATRSCFWAPFTTSAWFRLCGIIRWLMYLVTEWEVRIRRWSRPWVPATRSSRTITSTTDG